MKHNPHVVFNEATHCRKKRKFATKNDAKKARNHMGQDYPYWVFATYHCCFCNHYHVGRVEKDQEMETERIHRGRPSDESRRDVRSRKDSGDVSGVK